MYECEVDDNTIMLTNSTTHSMQDKICFHRDTWAQIMNNGARCSVTNMISILQNAKYFDKYYLAPVRMRVTTSKAIIILEAEDKCEFKLIFRKGSSMFMCSIVLYLLLLYYRIKIYYLLLLILLIIKGK